MIGETHTLTITPAPPGWYVALFVAGGEHNGETWEDYLALDPIIAWEIDRVDGPFPEYAKRPGERWVNHEVQPITTNGNMGHQGNPWAIKRPDGKYEIPHDTTFESEADTISYLKQQRASYLSSQRAEDQVVFGGKNLTPV
jgi:hypothetical protein